MGFQNNKLITLRGHEHFDNYQKFKTPEVVWTEQIKLSNGNKHCVNIKFKSHSSAQITY